MTGQRSGRLLFVATLAFASQTLLAQGLYYESVLKGAPFKDKSEVVSKTYLMPKMMKHVSSEDQDYIIIRLDKEKMISVDTKKKTYWEQTFAELEKSMKAASAKMEKQMAGMQEQLKNLPEEQRKMMEGMLGTQGGTAGNVQMSKSGETKKISGFSCAKYVAKEGEKELMTLWTTTDVKGFEPLRKDYEALSRRMTAMNPRLMKGLIDAMSKVEGFPIETDWGGMTNTVLKIEQRSTPESEFSIPAGFKKVTPPMQEMVEDDMKE
jgi:hypothetical protein